MDLNDVIRALFGLILLGVGWYCREIWGAVQKLRQDLYALEVRISTDYVRYDRLQDVMKPVLQKLDRIEGALSHKMDRDDRPNKERD